VILHDNAAPLGTTLFQVTDSTGVSDYLTVTAGRLTSDRDIFFTGAGKHLFFSNPTGVGPYVFANGGAASEIWFENGNTAGGNLAGLRQRDANPGQSASAWQLYVEAAGGGVATALLPGGVGALSILAGGLGGDGSALQAAGIGGQATVRGGNAGVDNGGGGASGGPMVVTGGHGSTGLASDDGIISLGEQFTSVVRIGSLSGGTGAVQIPVLVGGVLTPSSTYGIASTAAFPITAGANSTWGTSGGFLVIQAATDLDLLAGAAHTVVLGAATHDAQIAGYLTANINFQVGFNGIVQGAPAGAGVGGVEVIYRGGDGGATDGVSPGLQGGFAMLRGANGGAGDGSHSPGAGGIAYVIGGLEGAQAGFGGANGGDVIVDGGKTIHGARNGAVFIGTNSGPGDSATDLVLIGSPSIQTIFEGPVVPLSDGAAVQHIGSSAAHFNAAYFDWYDTKLGAQLPVAANTITPTSGLHHVDGTGGPTINTIAVTNVPAGANTMLMLIADVGNVILGAAGNIKVGGTINVNTGQMLVYDQNAGFWYLV
jgi:hypothetical protein